MKGKDGAGFRAISCSRHVQNVFRVAVVLHPALLQLVDKPPPVSTTALQDQVDVL